MTDDEKVVTPLLGHEIASFAADGDEWLLRCECGWYFRVHADLGDPTRPPSELRYRYAEHLDDVSTPKEAPVEVNRPPRGSLEIRCPRCRGYGHIPPTDLHDVTKRRCPMCEGSKSVLAAAIPSAVERQLPANLDYLEVMPSGKIAIHRKNTLGT